MKPILCIGEILIDFITTYTPKRPIIKTFQQHPGGAPANVAIGLAKLGREVYFAGKVGNDPFGKFLLTTLSECKVNTDYVSTSSINTTLAFVEVGKDGERSFFFIRNPGADTQLEKSDVKEIDFSKFSLIHFGSLSLTNNPARDAIYTALRLAKQAGCMISFDPNIRFSLWNSRKDIKKTINSIISDIHLCKLNTQELHFLTQHKKIPKASQILLDRGVKLVIVSLGKEGVYVRTSSFDEYIEGSDVEVVDTTGAGDALMAGILSRINTLHKIKSLTQPELIQIAKFSNAVAAISTTKKGAVYSLPERQEVEEFLGK